MQVRAPGIMDRARGPRSRRHLDPVVPVPAGCGLLRRLVALSCGQPGEETTMRPSGRAHDQMRPVRFSTNFTKYAEGSVLAEFGDTKVLCTASVEGRVPPWMRGAGRGWVTGEYGMLPRATH